jgi:hypothetical protein
MPFEVLVVELPVAQEEQRQQLAEDPYLQDEGNCGLYTTLLGTDRCFILLNWKKVIFHHQSKIHFPASVR